MRLFNTSRKIFTVALIFLTASVAFAGTKGTTPRNLKVEVINQTQVKVSWEGSINDGSYEIRRRESGSGEWVTYSVTAPSTNRHITGLKPATTYEWEVQSYNKSKRDASGFVAGEKFITMSNCPLPADYTVQSSGLSSATLSWAYNSDIQKYEVRVKAIDDDTWKNYFTEYASLSISNLLPYTEYEYQVRSFCADNTGAGSEFSSSEYFYTQSYIQSELSEITIKNKNAGMRVNSSGNIAPANNYVTMINTMGQTVKRCPISYTDASGGVYFDMNAQIPAGVYFVRVPAELSTEGQKMLVK